MEIQKQARQPISGARKPPTTDARAMPTGAPVCMNAPKRPRIFGGNVSPI